MSKKIYERFYTFQKTVTAVASKIVDGVAGVDTVTIQNLGATSVYLGHTAGVTINDGFPLQAGVAIEMASTSDVYAIVASGAANVAVMVEV